jgi:hypothetical protein
LSKGKRGNPAQIAKYLVGKFGDRLDEATQAMAELAAAYEPADLYRRGFRLYEQFRPGVPAGEFGWGALGASWTWRSCEGWCRRARTACGSPLVADAPVSSCESEQVEKHDRNHPGRRYLTRIVDRRCVESVRHHWTNPESLTGPGQ